MCYYGLVYDVMHDQFQDGYHGVRDFAFECSDFFPPPFQSPTTNDDLGVDCKLE
jgi:hypothetical protein